MGSGWHKKGVYLVVVGGKLCPSDALAEQGNQKLGKEDTERFWLELIFSLNNYSNVT